MSKEIKMSEDEANQLFGEIDNEGLGYWVQHYGYKGDEDPELVELCKKARKALNAVQSHIQDIWDEYEIG